MPRALRWLPPLLWSAFVWLMSSTTWDVPPAGGWLPDWVPADKLVHLTLFFVLAGLWARALPPDRRGLLVAWALAAAWGAVDEVHQAYVPGRSADPWDWLADAVGAALAVAVAGWRRAGRTPGGSELEATRRSPRGGR